MQVRRTSYFWALQSFKMFTGPLFVIKLCLLSGVLLHGYLWLGKILSNESRMRESERRCYICNVFSDWPRPCSTWAENGHKFVIKLSSIVIPHCRNTIFQNWNVSHSCGTDFMKMHRFVEIFSILYIFFAPINIMHLRILPYKKLLETCGKAMQSWRKKESKIFMDDSLILKLQSVYFKMFIMKGVVWLKKVFAITDNQTKSVVVRTSPAHNLLVPSCANFEQNCCTNP